jgi:hypothetical protein
MDDQEITTGFLLHIHGQFQQACSAAALAGWLLCEKDGATGGDFSVNPLVPVVHRLERARAGHVSIFRSVTGFLPHEFDELVARVGPVLVNVARSTGATKLKQGRRNKLHPGERILAFIFLMKHNTQNRYESSLWNYSRSSVCDDSLFVASAINNVLQD